MPFDDETSTAQRVSRILETGRTAHDSWAEPDSGREPVDVWPSSWPPGQPADLIEPNPLAGRSNSGIRAGSRWEVSSRTALAAVGLLALVVVIAVVLLTRGPSAGTLVPSADSTAFAVEPGAAATNSNIVAGSVNSTAAPGSGLPGTGPAAVGPAVSGPAATGSPAASASAVGQFRVYVVGQVRRPGVVSLAAGARVEDAVDAAGGKTDRADLAVMNLARKVIDGERIVVPRPGQKIPTDPAPAPIQGESPAGVTGTAGSGAPVDLNTATVADLDALPGVGPVIAGRIVAWRQQNGNFKTVDDLGEVSGIGDATLAKLRPLVRV